MSEELIGYLQRPGFVRLWPIVKKKYESNERVAGSIRLFDLSEEERVALEGLFSMNLFGKPDIRIPLKDLDEVLQETKYRCSLAECLYLLYQDQLITRQERADSEKKSWKDFCDWAATFAYRRELKQWVETLRKGKTKGYRVFMECYEQFREQGNCIDWVLAMKALHQLPAPRERLPLFAARTTGDAHGLDRQTRTGRIFYWGISAFSHELGDPIYEEGIEAEEERSVPMDTTGSEAQRAHYFQVGIVLDDVSSMVMLAGWAGFFNDPVALPLVTIEQPHVIPSPVSKIYIVENPSIFGAILDYWAKRGLSLPCPIVCTSGQPSLAALRLFDRTESYGTRIHYSGDFDVKGIEMAISLAKRYGDRFVPWRMDMITYESVQHPDLISFSEAEKETLGRMNVGWDNLLVATVKERGKKVFQEHIVRLLIGDLENI
jgi:uncharacterized protein (TIGR02679 family)